MILLECENVNPHSPKITLNTDENKAHKIPDISIFMDFLYYIFCKNLHLKQVKNFTFYAPNGLLSFEVTLT